MLKPIFSRETDDEVHSTLHFAGGKSANISVNWSDESHRKMTTRITVWGTAGRIFADRQEIQVYLRDGAAVPEGYERGWNVRYGTELTGPVGFYLRGEEYSAQIEHFAERVREGRVDGVNGFESAAETDRVIAMLIADAASARRRRARPARSRPRGPAAAPPAADPVGGAAARGAARAAGGILMERLLFGDNQFFGVNHMSEEKARAQAMRFQSLDAVMEVLDAAYDAGVRTFMCTTHDRVGEICRPRPAGPGALRGLRLLPVHAVRPQVRERGHRGRHARRAQAVPAR